MLQHYIQNQLYLLNPILPARLSTEMTLAYLEPVISHTTFITFREISLSYIPVKPTFSVIPFLISARGNFPSSEPLQYLLYISFLMFFLISAFIRTIYILQSFSLNFRLLKNKNHILFMFFTGLPMVPSLYIDDIQQMLFNAQNNYCATQFGIPGINSESNNNLLKQGSEKFFCKY